MCAVVAKLTRRWRSNMFAALIMCTMLLTQTSWKRLSFYKCFRRKLFDLNSGFLLFVLCLLTIVSDAALVARTFEITHFSNFESRWLLPVWLFGELGISLLHALFQLHTVSLIRNTPLKRPKRSPRGVHVIFDPATTKPRRHFFVVISSFVVCHFVIFTQAPKGRN